MLIHDFAISDTNHTYSQLFQCHENTELISYNDKEVVLQIKGTDWFIRIEQLMDNTESEVIEGVVSRKLNELTNINVLKFNTQGLSSEYVTKITVENTDGEIQDLKSIKLNKEKRVVEVVDSDNDSYKIL